MQNLYVSKIVARYSRCYDRLTKRLENVVCAYLLTYLFATFYNRLLKQRRNTHASNVAALTTVYTSVALYRI